MPPQRKRTPSYLIHKQSGRGRLVWTDSSGTRHQELLPGPFESPESLGAKARRELELATSPARTAEPNGLTVAEVLLAYLDHAQEYYRDPHGNPARELDHIRLSIRPVREIYPDIPAAEFGPVRLKAVRQRMIDGKLCRSQINKRIDRIKRAFRWAASEELIPPSVYEALRTLPGLRLGRSDAVEREPVGPVDEAVVDATLPFLNRHVRGLVEFQQLTGCRPGEACAIRRCDIDTGGPIWMFKPPHHKTAWRGKSRTIAIGPKAKELLQGFFTPNITDYLFSPVRAVAEVRAERAANRKTPRYSSHMKRNAAKRVSNPKRIPAEKYDRTSYLHAIARACDRAFLPPVPLAQRKDESRARWWARLTDAERAEVKAWQSARRWHPNQLRHSFATRVRKHHGLEAAQVLLGHSRADVTQVYAERNEALAAEVAAKIG